MRAVRAHAVDVLHKHLVVGETELRFVRRKLQADAAELGRAPVEHQRVAGRAVTGEHREIRRAGEPVVDDAVIERHYLDRQTIAAAAKNFQVFSKEPERINELKDLRTEQNINQKNIEK